MKLLRIAPLLLAAALLSGCAALSSVSSEVASYGDWPASRAPGTYAFERLPSQQAQLAEIEALEAAAAPALAQAGFTPAPAGAAPDVLVQLGSRYQRSEDSRWDDRLWWSAGFGHWRRGYGLGPRWSFAYAPEPQRYDREVALLIRDRATGKPLFEARASNEGLRRDDPVIQAALFQAALLDFPRLGINPRRVTVALPATP